ncbi:hypothetical protein ABPG75_008204 [Micractinium tetrahymenae]
MAALAPPHQPLAAPVYPMQHQGPLGDCAFPAQQLAAGVPPTHRPPLPSGPQPAQQHAQTHRTGPHSNLTHGLQLQAAGAGRGGIVAGTCVAAPVLAPAAAAPELPCFPGQPAPFYPGSSWPAYPQAQAVAPGGAYGRPATCAGPAAAAAVPAAPWPTLAPHAGSYQLFHPSQGAVHPTAAAALHPMQQQLAAAAAPGDAGASRRRTRRRPTARRSLLNLFDAAASEEACELSEESDSDCDMVMASQDSADSALTAAASFPGPFAASPGTLSAAGDASAASTPTDLLPCSAGCDTPSLASEGGTPPPGDRRCDGGGGGLGPLPAGEHMLPLQHLLMSERAQHLTALEVKAIVYKVAADLAELHDAGILHRHVTIASVALARSGNLATARLMGHPYNVAAGPGRRYTGGKKAGVDAYMAPELARCPSDCVAYTPAGDLWSLGIVLFVLLSGSHVPFGNRGLCWTSIPNMPGPHESVDRLQRWLEEHLVCKLGVINQLKESQQKGKAPLGAGPEMRVVGLDGEACDLLLRLLAADPAARPTARQVLGHPWLSEVDGLMPHAQATAGAARQPPARSPGFEDRLRRAASDLACLGFSPGTPHEEAGAAANTRLLRRSSTMSSDAHFEWPQAPTQGPDASQLAAHGGAGSAAGSAECLAELPARAGHCPGAAAPGALHPCSHGAPGQAQQQGWQQQQQQQQAGSTHPARSLVLGDGTALQLIPPDTAAALAASGLLPDLGAQGSAGYRTLGYAVQPVEVEVEGQRLQLCALHAVFDVGGQPMLCAKPVAVTQPLPGCIPPPPAPGPEPAPPPPSRSAPCCAPGAPPGSNPDEGTSAPILPLLARMLQQQQS